MLFADEQEPSNAPDTPATEKNLKEQFDGALFNKGTFIFSFSMFFFLFPDALFFFSFFGIVDFQKNFWNTFNNVANLAIVALIVLRLSEFAASQVYLISFTWS